MPRSKDDRQFLMEAILGRILDWPDDALNELFEMMDSLEKKHDLLAQLDDETLAMVREGLAQAERGEFATDEEMERIAAWVRQTHAATIVVADGHR